MILNPPYTQRGVAERSPTAAETSCDYLLVCQAQTTSLEEGTWHFALESSDGSYVFSADDVEFGDLNRLTLLAAVRGLEAIDGPSAVTLLSHNRYLIRSLSESLPRWRENNFVWEHFGRRIDVQHADLWRRIDRALSIHRVEACLVLSRLVSTGTDRSSKRTTCGPDESVRMRVDSPHPGPEAPHVQGLGAAGQPADRLRRWLMAAGAGGEATPPRRRFTAADLMQTA